MTESPPSVSFRATLELFGKTATGLVVPPGLVEQLGRGKRPPVTVTINDYSYASTVAPMGGQFLVGVAAEHRAGAKVAAGDDLDVTLTLDTSERTVTVPDDLANALAAVPGARRRFDELSYTNRREIVTGIESAKKADTRARRISAAVERLR
jgi:hypothetical protein